MAEIRLKFGKGDTPTEAMAIDPTGTEDPRRMTELLNMAAGRAAMARIGQRLFGHSLVTATKEGLMRSGQSWWEHSYKGAKTDKEARENFVTFAQEQGDPFFTISCQPPDSYIYFGAARWADQGFPTITMGERLCAALCGTEIPEDWYEEIRAPWKAFVIEIPQGTPPLITVYDPEQQKRTRATRILVQVVTDGGTPEEDIEWWWMLYSECDQHFWRQGTTRQILKPVEFGDTETARYRIHNPEAFGEEIAQDERIYHLVSRLVFNSILTLTDPERVKPTGSSHKRWEGTPNRRPGQVPEQRVFIIGKPIKIDLRQNMRDYLEGRSKKSFKVTTQFPVHGHWRWQPYGPKSSLRRRQWIEPHWRGPTDGVIPVRQHDLKGPE